MKTGTGRATTSHVTVAVLRIGQAFLSRSNDGLLQGPVCGQSRPKCKAKQPNYELRGRFVCLSFCVCVCSSTLFDYLQRSSAWIIIAPNCLHKQQTLGRSSCSTTSLLSTQQSTTGQYSVPHKFSSLSPSISKIHFYIVPHFTLKYVFRVKVMNN